MHKFTRSLLTEWRKLKLPFAGETILIAVSGGADSVALTLALRDLREAEKLKLNFIVAHFNHGLRGAESDADAEFVKRLAEQLDFKFICGIQNPKSKIQNRKGNLEQSARNARYEFLLNLAEKQNAFAVLTAHTMNDQAETLLLNLLRGSGIAGLGAMRRMRNLECGMRNETDSNFEEQNLQITRQPTNKDQSAIRTSHSAIQLVRPLLSWAKREMTENFAREKEIEFRHDSMNADEKFSRVRIRRKLIPLLREFNPKIVETLARTARLLQENAEQLSIANYQLSEELSVKELQSLSKSAVYQILREWLKFARGDLRQITFSHVEAIERLIFSRKSGREVELPNNESVIKRRGKIIFEKSKVEKSGSGN